MLHAAAVVDMPMLSHHSSKSLTRRPMQKLLISQKVSRERKKTEEDEGRRIRLASNRSSRINVGAVVVNKKIYDTRISLKTTHTRPAYTCVIRNEAIRFQFS